MYKKEQDDIIEKIKSFSHTELVKQVDLSRSNISNLRENRKNIFTNSNLKKVEMNESYPKFVLNNLDKFSNFILKWLIYTKTRFIHGKFLHTYIKLRAELNGK